MSSLAPVPAAVVYDINVLVTAAASGNSPFRSWPSPPLVSGNAPADCLGVIVDAAEFALWLSPHIITNIDTILAQLFKWAQPQVDAYLRAVGMAAEHSGGGIVADVPRTVHDCPDHEDNLILDLAAEVGALLIVSNDTDLLSMSPWRGTPVIEPAAATSPPYSAVIAQLDPPMGAILRPFDRMRRTRNRSEYPSFTTPDVTPDNVRADLPVAESIVEVCGSVLDEMSPY